MGISNIREDSYIVLAKLQSILGYKDMRSVMAWCNANGVCVIVQGKQKLVNRYEFLLSFYKPFINHLRAKHTNWKEMALHYIEGNMDTLLSHVFRDHVAKQQRKRKGEVTEFLQMLEDL